MAVLSIPCSDPHFIIVIFCLVSICLGSMSYLLLLPVKIGLSWFFISCMFLHTPYLLLLSVKSGLPCSLFGVCLWGNLFAIVCLFLLIFYIMEMDFDVDKAFRKLCTYVVLLFFFHLKIKNWAIKLYVLTLLSTLLNCISLCALIQAFILFVFFSFSSHF